MKPPTSNPLPQPTLPESNSISNELPGLGFSPFKFNIPHDDFSLKEDFAQNDEFFCINIPSDESDEPSYDILKAYPRIGAVSTVTPNGSPSKPTRPAFSRSSTTRF